MFTTTATRTINAPTQQLWELVSDPHHLPRWWPRVDRVEGVDQDAFTEVMRTSSGRVVRADFLLDSRDEEIHQLCFSQRIDGTPFARVLKQAETEFNLAAVGSATGEQATEVTIRLRQSPRGIFPRFGSRMIRRAAARTLQEALDGLERIVG